MPLVIEDGSGVTDANSYGTLQGAKDYATARGITLGDDATITAQLIKAMDYLNALTYVGSMVSDTQALPWPRTSVFYPSGASYPSTTIPQALINAQYQLVIEQTNGIDIMPSVDWHGQGGFVIEDKVDVITTKYSDRVGTGSQPTMPKVDALLANLLGSTPGALRTLRI